MSSNQKNSGIKSTLEFGPVIVFFAAYILFDRYEISLNFYGQNYEGFVLATTIFIPLILLTTFLFVLTLLAFGDTDLRRLVFFLFLLQLLGLKEQC